MVAVAVCCLWLVCDGASITAGGEEAEVGRRYNAARNGKLKGWRLRVRISSVGGFECVDRGRDSCTKEGSDATSEKKPCKRAADAVAREILRFADKTEGSASGWLRWLRG